VNGQQQLTSPGGAEAEAGTLTATSTAGTGISPGTTTASNKFVLTPEYIQHSEYSSVVNERVEEALVLACRASSLAVTCSRKYCSQRMSALLSYVADVGFEALRAHSSAC
jgi:hypothetical protein